MRRVATSEAFLEWLRAPESGTGTVLSEPEVGNGSMLVMTMTWQLVVKTRGNSLLPVSFLFLLWKWVNYRGKDSLDEILLICLDFTHSCKGRFNLTSSTAYQIVQFYVPDQLDFWSRPTRLFNIFIELLCFNLPLLQTFHVGFWWFYQTSYYLLKIC